MKTTTRVAVLLMSIVIAAAPVYARGKKKSKGSGATTSPRSYQDWGPDEDIDELEVIKTFKFSDYTKIVVVPFDTKGVKMPDEDDNTYEPVKKVVASATEGFAKGLRGEVTPAVSIDKAPKGAGTLVIRGRLVTLDPGSKAARYWAGFGAGAARAKIEGEIVDAKTSTVLAKFTQERRSGVGLVGGDYQEMMQRNLSAIGEDVAKILKAF